LRVHKLAMAVALCVAVAVGLAACGSSSKSSKVSGKTLTIYSSLPQQASDRQQTLDVIDGEKMALSQAGNKVGNFTIKFVSLDDATAAAGKWDPGQVSTNARQAAQDPNTIAYIGEFNSGASAISIPILNQAGILQVSPANTAIALTRPNPADPGSPNKYYPALATNGRTYARVVPVDTFQAAAQLKVMQGLGVKKVYVLNDKETYGQGIAISLQQTASKYGITAVGNEGIDPKASNYRALAQKIKSSGSDAMFFGGITNNGAVQLWNDVAASNPTMKLFGPDGVDEDSFSSKIDAGAQKNTYLSTPGLPTDQLPPSGKQFLQQFQATYHHAPQPYAIFGYEAMSSVLDAIKRAGAQGNSRSAVVKSFFSTKNRSSVLGTYSIDSGGDTSLATYVFSTVKGGQRPFFKFVKV
jgi:branched-chain amino acid transport system substrate-binding protein